MSFPTIHHGINLFFSGFIRIHSPRWRRRSGSVVSLTSWIFNKKPIKPQLCSK
jgi:predicted phosphatase